MLGPIYIYIYPPHRRGGIAIQWYAYVCVWVSMCLVFFGVFGWIPMAPELRIAWSPMAPELRIALKTYVFGNYIFLRFLTHNRALNFMEAGYCRELRYGTLCFESKS